MNKFSKLNNSLIKINSLKILSIIGYIMLFVILYIELIAFPTAFDIDKQTGCHFDANWPMCKAHDVEFDMLGTIALYGFLALIFTLIAILEALFSKFIKKSKKEASYHITWSVLFWIGLLPAIAANLFWVVVIFDEYIIPWFNFQIYPIIKKLLICFPAIILNLAACITAPRFARFLIKKLNKSLG